MKGFPLQNVHVISSSTLHFLFHLGYRKIYKYNYTHNYMYNYSFRILSVQFHITHMQSIFHWSCPPLWNIDRAVLEEFNVKNNIKSRGCNSKKLIKTKNCFYFFVSISIQQYHHIHTPVSPYPYTSITISIHQYHHIHTPVSPYPYTSITISIHQYHHIKFAHSNALLYY